MLRKGGRDKEIIHEKYMLQSHKLHLAFSEEIDLAERKYEPIKNRCMLLYNK